PAGPCAPWAPAGPTGPAGPAGPATPVGPVGPTSPVLGPTQFPLPSMTVAPFTTTEVGWMVPTASPATSAYGVSLIVWRGTSSGSAPTLTPRYFTFPSQIAE